MLIIQNNGFHYEALIQVYNVLWSCSSHNSICCPLSPDPFLVLKSICAKGRKTDPERKLLLAFPHMQDLDLF